ncbi:MAG: TetR/AcrR family transcriptional regulator [Pseudomonadota bacterium]
MARKTGSSGEKTAQAVRKAAINLIAQHGYAAVSMRQIAREVGVQAGALYLYTPDKQTLLFDIMSVHMEELLAAAERAFLPGDAPLSDRLEAFVRFHISHHIGRQAEVFISYMELRNLEPENFNAVEALRRRYEDMLGKILSDGARAGVFATGDLRVSTMAMIAMLTGVSTWFSETGRLTPAAIEDHYVELAFRMVGAPPPALSQAAE